LGGALAPLAGEDAMVDFKKMSRDEFRKSLLVILERMAEAADQHDVFVPEVSANFGKVSLTLKFDRLESGRKAASPADASKNDGGGKK
jgi:hypothetical protein